MNLKVRRRVPLLAAVVTGAFTACGSSPTATNTPPPAGSPSAAASASAVATTLDPCQLVTASEASSLAGAAYGPGRPESESGGGMACIYGYQTRNVFMVLVTQAADANTANATWDQERVKADSVIQKALGSGANISINLNDVSSLQGASRAAVGTGTFSVSGHAFGLSAIYVIKNAIFFTFSDLQLGQSVPSASAMEAQAQTVIGRLP